MQAVSCTQPIQVPATTLWKAITSDHHLEVCHPYIKRHTKNAREQGISDVITYLNDVTFTRASTAWFEGTGYDLLVGKDLEPKNEVQWRIDTVNSTSCTLTISVTPRAVEKLPRIVRRIALALFVRRQLALYLEAVTSGIKSWMESGSPIDKSAFRKHTWFSA